MEGGRVKAGGIGLSVEWEAGLSRRRRDSLPQPKVEEEGRKTSPIEAEHSATRTPAERRRRAGGGRTEAESFGRRRRERLRRLCRQVGFGGSMSRRKSGYDSDGDRWIQAMIRGPGEEKLDDDIQRTKA